MKTVQTPKGTVLPLTNLKGKDYLMVAYRIQWFNEVVPEFNVTTEIIKSSDNESIMKAQIQVLDGDKVIRSSTAHKREDSKGFPDHLEKAETGAVGRALLLLGYGTQFALADLDEGNRLADSPLEVATQPKPKIEETSINVPTVASKPSFRAAKKVAPVEIEGDSI